VTGGPRARALAAFPALASPVYRRFLLASMIITVGVAKVSGPAAGRALA